MEMIQWTSLLHKFHDELVKDGEDDSMYDNSMSMSDDGDDKDDGGDSSDDREHGRDFSDGDDESVSHDGEQGDDGDDESVSHDGEQGDGSDEDDGGDGSDEDEEEMVNSNPTEVWWDYENAAVPYGMVEGVVDEGRFVYQAFVNSLRRRGFRGPVRIRIVRGYRDSFVPDYLMNSPDFRVYTAKPEEDRGKDSKEDQSADVEINEQIVEWFKEGHKPQNVMLVTGDKGFKDSLEELVKRGHTTIVVRREELQEGAKSRWAKIKNANYLWGWKTFLGVSEEEPTREEQRFAKFIARKKKEKSEKSEEAKQIVKERKARQKENRRIRRVAESQEKRERKAEESENKKRKAEESEIGNIKKKRKKTHKKKKKVKPITGPYAKKPI